MLRVLNRLALASVCLVTVPVLEAAEPGPDALGAAIERSRNAVAEARRRHRDPHSNRTVDPRGQRALTAPGRASRSGSNGFLGADFPDADRDTTANAQADIKSLLVEPRLEVASGSAPGDGDPPPLVFVSFSMPAASLRSLLAEAATAGSPLVLAGLVENSMQRTAARLGELLGTDAGAAKAEERTPSLAIDPTLFQRFGVDKVPTFVLPLEAVVPCTPDGCPVPDHLKVAGDVRLAYALGIMARETPDTTLGSTAERWRQRLGVRP